MSTPSSAPSPDDEVLARFMLELEAALDRDAVVRKYGAAYPHLAEEFRALAAMGQKVGDARPAPAPGIPNRLGEFRIVRQVACGGMGEVYEAVQERLQRRVALKIIRQGRTSPEARERFLREQAVLARLHQTHIVPIHTAGEEGPLQYFVMPFIEGATLHDTVGAARQLETSALHTSTPRLARLASLVAESRKVATGPAPTTAAEVDAGGTPGRPGVQRTLAEAADLSGAGHIAAAARISPSPDYFRSVAKVLAEAAEAVQHAHDAGVLHRDIKPSNIMVDTDEQCWIIDFGLAGYLGKDGGPGAGGPAPAPPSGPVAVSGVMGTPPYMAPEQAEGKADVRTDVWGLGVTLYELLTLRRAFPDQATASESRVREDPPPPHTLVANLPADLGAICGKAMRKDSAGRYQSAAEFAADLRRWMSHEPTKAWGAWAGRRLWLWTKRNPGWAAMFVVAALSTIFLVVEGYFTLESKTQAAEANAAAAQARVDVAEGEAQAAEDRQKAAEEREEQQRFRAQAAEEREREQRFRALIQKLILLRLNPRGVGWFEDSKAVVREATKIRPSDSFLRDQAAADLAGFDARQFKNLYGFGASSVAFSGDGKRLLIGGWEKDEGKVLDLADPGAAPVPSGQGGEGPVAFRADGAPLQLVMSPGEGEGLLLWDADKRRAVGSFTIPDQPKYRAEALALAANGAFVAAAMTPKDRADEKHKPLVALWEAEKKDPVKTWDVRASALAFTPDGGILAVAGEDTRAITLWSVPKGERLAALPTGSAQIDSLAFGRSPRRSHGKPGPEGKWQMATGALGGEVVVWDLGDKVVRALCRGLRDGVSSLAFSPDGALLVGAGRGKPILWDAATGRPLLHLNYHNTLGGVAFSPDGKRVALASMPIFEPRSISGLDVWKLENGRGIRTLLGLSAASLQVAFSPDGKLAACLAQNWQVAIWDAESGRLRYVLDVPKGPLLNYSMAFNSDGRRLAFSAGTEAKSWDIATGEEVGSWELPPGLVDAIAFNADGKLLLLRTETKDAKVLPVGNNFRKENPRVCRLRELPEGGRARLIQEITDFSRHVFHTEATPDGRVFVVVGLEKAFADGGRTRVCGYDGATGKMIWEMQGTDSSREIGLRMHPSGKLVALRDYEPRERTIVLDPLTGKTVRLGQSFHASFSPPDKYWWDAADGGLGLVRGKEEQPFVVLGVGSPSYSGWSVFDAPEQRVLSGNADGSVSICDIEEVRKRLTDLGLGW